ncbi:MAG TPA: hypothetical protein VH475_26330, partial [Tepidisphaeraceae bacterium]
MNLPIQDPVMSPAVKPKSGPSEKPLGPEFDFKDRLSQQGDGGGDAARRGHGPNGVGKPAVVDASAKVDPNAATDGVRRVTRGTVPDRQDMFGQIDRIRKDFDA